MILPKMTDKFSNREVLVIFIKQGEIMAKKVKLKWTPPLWGGGDAKDFKFKGERYLFFPVGKV